MRGMHNACGDSKQYCPKRYLGRKSYVKLCKIQSRSAFDRILPEMLSGRSHIHQAMQNCKVARSAFFPATGPPAIVLQQPSLQYPARQRCMDCALCASHDLANEVVLEITPSVPRIQSAHAQSTYHLAMVLMKFRANLVPELLLHCSRSSYNTLHAPPCMYPHDYFYETACFDETVATFRGVATPKPGRSGNTICRALDHLIRMA